MPPDNGRPNGRQWLLAGAAAIVVGGVITSAESLAALLAPSIIGVLALLVIVRRLSPADDPVAYHRMVRWVVVSFVAHLALGLLLHNLAGVLAFLRSDSLTYQSGAIDIVAHWNGDQPMPDLPAGKEGFYYLLAGLYWLFGAHPTAGLAVNALLAAALVPVVSDLTRRLFGPEPARYAGPLMALLPGLLIWTSQLLKEAAVLLLIAVAANAAVRMTEKVTLASLVAATASVALLLSFRGPVGLVVAAGLVSGIAFGRSQLITGLGSGLSTLGVMAVLVLSLGLGYSGFHASTASDLEQANSVRRDLALSARTGFDAEVDISTAKGAFSYLPQGLLSFGVGPFPWQMQGIGQLTMVPDVLAWWLLLPSLWRGVRVAFRRVARRILVLLLPALATACLLALVVSNFGTVVRERGQVVVLLVPLIALGLAERARERAGGEVNVEAALVHR